MRKSFIIHNDSLAVLDDLSVEQCGELFLAIKSYQLGEELELSPIVKIAYLAEIYPKPELQPVISIFFIMCLF